MDEKKLKKLKELLTIVNEGISNEDFVKSFNKVIEFVKKIDARNIKEFERLTQTITSLSKKLEKDGSETNDKLQRQITAELESLLRRFSSKSKELDIKMSEIKNGEDADEEKIVKDVLSQIKLPEYKETVLDGEEEIRKKILPLEIEDIDGLQEELDKIKKQSSFISGGGGNASGGKIVRAYDLSSKLNGVLKTFSLPTFWRVISVHSSSFPNAFRPTTDYTTDGSAMTITFTSEIGAATTLATGQTITVIYSE